MGLYDDKKDYEELVKENIAKVLKLLEEKEKIKEKNGIFANFKLKIINKKIEKIKKKAT